MTDIKMSNTFDLPVGDGEFTLVAMSKHTYISMNKAAVIAINSYDANQERIAELEALCRECADYLDTNKFTSIHNDSYLHRDLRSNALKEQNK